MMQPDSWYAACFCCFNQCFPLATLDDAARLRTCCICFQEEESYWRGTEGTGNMTRGRVVRRFLKMNIEMLLDRRIRKDDCEIRNINKSIVWQWKSKIKKKSKNGNFKNQNVKFEIKNNFKFQKSKFKGNFKFQNDDATRQRKNRVLSLVNTRWCNQRAHIHIMLLGGRRKLLKGESHHM